MKNGLQEDIVRCLEALCCGQRAQALSFLDELENSAFVEGIDCGRCLNRCRQAVTDRPAPSDAAILAIDECVVETSSAIRLLLLGISNGALDVPAAASRLASFFPGHDLREDDRFIVEMAYQLDHDRRDRFSDSFEELVLAARQRSEGK